MSDTKLLLSERHELPEESPGLGLGTESERESSVSWAPSAMGHRGAGAAAAAAGAPADDELPTGRVGSFFGGGAAGAGSAGAGTGAGTDSSSDETLNGLGTPRLQNSPTLRAKSLPLGSSSLYLSSLNNNSGNYQSNAGGAPNGGLSSVPQSPVPPQSVAEMLAEMEQQSFQVLANKCSKTVSKQKADQMHLTY